MAYYEVHGGKRLSGTIQTGSGKNATIALLFAALLIKGKTVLKEMTKVQEVHRVLELLQSIGVQYTWLNDTTIEINTKGKLRLGDIDKKACASGRISVLLLGALAKREKSYTLYQPAGCNLGKRTINPHIFALEKLGISITPSGDHYNVETEKLKGTDVVMYESGDTTTENVIMAAVLAKGTTVIKFASSNYMVQDLCHFLKKAGANIDGIGTTTLTITGVAALHPQVEYSISPDPIDAMAWIALAITTQSTITITNCPLDFLELELEKLSVMGQKFILSNKRNAKDGKGVICDIQILPSTLVALPDKIYGRPFPGLNIDNLPFFAPIATRAKGKTLIHDWPYENRALYNLEFQKMGANVILLDPHRVIIEGPTQLTAAEIIAPNAIRPAMSILIAMIAAKGTSILRSIYPIERAYDNLIERLQSIGVDIVKVS